MTRCVVCGKRIWNELVSIPGKGDYHYRCADESGVLLSLEISREAIKKKAQELLEEIEPQVKKAMASGDSKKTAELRSRLEKELAALRMQEMIIVRRELKAETERKRGGA